MRKVLQSSALSAIALLIGCATTANGAPAVLTDDSAENVAALKAGLAAALSRANVELGAGDPTEQSVVVVLPPRPTAAEDRSLVKPLLFDLWIENGACFAIARETRARTRLSGVSCRSM